MSSEDQEEDEFIETQTKRLAMLQKVAKKRRGRKNGESSSYLSALSRNEGPSNAQVIDIEYHHPPRREIGVTVESDFRQQSFKLVCPAKVLVSPTLV